MAALASADILAPEDFHKITRLRLCKIGEVAAQPEFVKQSRCPWAICIPAPPNAFTVMLIANDQLIEGGEIELQLAALAQRLQCLDEHQISRSGTEARVGGGWNNEEFPRFEMRDGLQLNCREVGSGIATAPRHFADLVQDQLVKIFSA